MLQQKGHSFSQPGFTLSLIVHSAAAVLTFSFFQETALNFVRNNKMSLLHS